MCAQIGTHLIVVWENALLHCINRTQKWPVCYVCDKNCENCEKFRLQHLARGFLTMRGKIFFWMYAREGERGRRDPSNGFTSGSIAVACIALNSSILLVCRLSARLETLSKCSPTYWSITLALTHVLQHRVDRVLYHCVFVLPAVQSVWECALLYDWTK